jgi:hypothetical protein
MRIFAKKAFEFKNTEGGSEKTAPLAFADLPEWVAKDNMFQWGLVDGDIEIIADKKDETDVEKGGRTRKPKDTKDDSTDKKDETDVQENTEDQTTK